MLLLQGSHVYRCHVIGLSLPLSARVLWFVCLFVSLSPCLSVCLSVLCVRLSRMRVLWTATLSGRVRTQLWFGWCF